MTDLQEDTNMRIYQSF